MKQSLCSQMTVLHIVFCNDESIYFLYYLGIYFLLMIVMVCLSVAASALVIHSKYTSRPVPGRVKEICLGFLPKYVGLSYLTLNPSSANNDKEVLLKTSIDCDKEITRTGNPESSARSGEYVNGDTVIGSGRLDLRRCVSPSELKEINGKLRYILKDMRERKSDNQIRSEWSKISAVIDRCLLYIFISFALLTTCALLIGILTGSGRDYSREIQISEDYDIFDVENVTIVD